MKLNNAQLFMLNGLGLCGIAFVMELFRFHWTGITFDNYPILFAALLGDTISPLFLLGLILFIVGIVKRKISVQAGTNLPIETNKDSVFSQEHVVKASNKNWLKIGILSVSFVLLLALLSVVIISIFPKDAKTYLSKAYVNLEKGSYDSSLSDVNKAIELKSDFAEAYAIRSLIYDKKSDYSHSVNDILYAKKLNPNLYYDIDIRSNVPIKYLVRGYVAGDHDKAILDFSNAIQLNPNFSEAYYHRGYEYNNIGNYTQALADFTRAIEIDHNYVNAYSERGLIYARQNKYTEAIADFKKVEQIGPADDWLYGTRGDVYVKQGNYGEAIDDYKKVLVFKPNDYESYQIIASIYNKIGNYQEAIVNITKAIDIKPNDSDSYNTRAVTYYYLKDYDKAWSDVQKIEELGGAVNSEFMSLLKKDSGRDS